MTVNSPPLPASMRTSGNSFEDLEIWRRGCQLSVTVYRSLDDVKDYGLRDQMRRSAVSIPSNIAEGSERSKTDFVQFLRMVAGSAAELRTQTYIAARIGLVDNQPMTEIVDETKQLARMTQSLINKMSEDE